ncbi:nucleoside diphosphate sugar epimerase [Fusarium tjaetaba]|uniref:Nucleoside diphosphate sugar epimerase n=1 Tax=Fusarium tjaetaba TaxID=1567544 RepID=A0A8H5VUH3_9HYPO|nr:nucleoside diphosphate sugar epimerase [Fusarium tjaetaba]KAF5633829.1 nucleoside diphosphate sugar epimerase [Fusarium tjaetaba]
MWILRSTISKQRQAYGETDANAERDEAIEWRHNNCHKRILGALQGPNSRRKTFVTVQARPDKTSDKAAKRLARSHAVKQALQKKRQLKQESMQHFSVRTIEDEPEQTRSICRRQCSKRTIPSPASLSASLLDPFQSLAVDCKRLQILLNDFNARQAPEPVFSIEDGFQNFQSVFRSGLVDPALLNAVMLSLAFTANGGIINKECLEYQGQAIHHIRERIIMPDKVVSESTIGAILLLVGVEARLGTTSQVQLHMGAIQYLLNACEPVVVNLTQGIKRAIFWQDLNSSIMVGSKRIVDHTTFTELRWQRDSIAPDFFELPSGFQVRSHLFSQEFLDIVRDIHALQCIRNIYQRTGRPVSTVNINSHTASIQSRLQALPNTCPISKACHLAAYMCSVMLCCKVCTGTTGFIGGDAFYALHKAHPDWKYTILVRSEDKGKDVQKQYPDVKLAIGSLDDSKVIEKAASEADIVIHTAESSDHQGAAKAIAAGLRSTHSSSNPGYWIHISGTGILCWYDMDNKRYGEAPLPEQAYNDLEGVDKVTSLPDTAFHRDVDKIVLGEAAKDPSAVKVAIVCPPTIYGTGRGPANQRSRQIPGLTETTLEKGFGPIIGAGETEWDNVHVHDLSNLLVLLSERAASSEKQSDEQEIWGPKGYFFAENGKHKWSQISALIAKEAKKQGVIDSDETKVLDVDEAQKKLGFQALSWGLNSRGEAKRARKFLGWKPVGESLEEWIPESVQIEAKRLNKA